MVILHTLLSVLENNLTITILYECQYNELVQYIRFSCYGTTDYLKQIKVRKI